MTDRILFVDDDAKVLAAFRRLFRKRFTVDTAEGAAAGLARFSEDGPYAVVVSDLNMPAMDGITFLSMAHKHYPDTVRIMLTGNPDLSSAMDAVNKGQVFRFLTKPWDPDGLAEALEDALVQHEIEKADAASNQGHPLIQRLMAEAPGTFQHATAVVSLCETAGRAIGANVDLVRRAALFHDIGKLSAPGFFIENQFSGSNPHDALTPAQSAAVLAAHVTDGCAMAKLHHLPRDLCDLIAQHHGCRAMGYFYARAIDQAGGDAAVVDKSQYDYPGPRPQTREAGILLLADVIEASARSVDTPTPERFQEHITRICRQVQAEDELAESGLTPADVAQASLAFQSVLLGIHHHRIAYPEAG